MADIFRRPDSKQAASLQQERVWTSLIGGRWWGGGVQPACLEEARPSCHQPVLVHGLRLESGGRNISTLPLSCPTMRCWVIQWNPCVSCQSCDSEMGQVIRNAILFKMDDHSGMPGTFSMWNDSCTSMDNVLCVSTGSCQTSALPPHTPPVRVVCDLSVLD